MKVAELKKTISGYSRNTLERIIAEMYKAIPKSVKENRGIDSLILNPNGARGEPKAPAQPDMDAIQCEIEEFLSNAYNQYYFAPNSVVPKRERPKWRFIARRLFKELNRAAGNSAYATHAAQLLKRLYEMLCYSCDYILFSGYDPFESVGISQADFFRAVLTVERKIEPPRQFIRNSILLALANSLNRYTLYEGLLEILVGFLETADMKQIAVEICDDVRKEAAAKRLEDGSENPHAAALIRRQSSLCCWQGVVALLIDEALKRQENQDNIHARG